MEKFGYTELPLWQIIGKATLTSCKQYRNEEEFNQDKDKHLSERKFEEFGFVLSNVRRVKPIETHGKLHFWNYVGKIEELPKE